MKVPKYPKTPMRNCLYCKWYNSDANACSAPGAEKIAVFNPQDNRDCLLLRYDKTETPVVKEKSFVSKFCVGKKCPFYHQTLNLCTRPSKCPYADKEASIFDNLKFDEDF